MTRLELRGVECVESSKESSSRSSVGLSVSPGAALLAWIRLLIAALFAAAALAYASGCARTVLVPESAPIRIGPETRARIYAIDPESKQWRLSENRVAIPEGWYCVPPSFVEDDADG